MQDTRTGDMVEITEDVAKEANEYGYCVLAIGELIDVKNVKYKVNSFRNKKLLIDVVNINVLDIGEKVKIKGGSFIVETKGLVTLVLRGLPGNEIINQDVVDEHRKKAITDLRKVTLAQEKK